MAILDRVKGLFSPTIEAGTGHDNCNTGSSKEVSLCSTSELSPELKSADDSFLPVKNYIKGDIRNLIDSHGFAAGLIRANIDGAIGTGLKCCPKPDYVALGVTPEQAKEWSKVVSAKFNLWANDYDNTCNVQRILSFSDMQRLVAGSLASSGEAFAVAQFMRSRDYKTSINLIDPDRVETPDRHKLELDSNIRDGVELTSFGEPTAYYIRNKHRSEVYLFTDNDYTRIRRKTTFGRLNVLHVYEQTREGLTRGIPLLAPVVQKLEMLSDYQKQELQKAILQNKFALFIESDYPNSEVQEALGADQEEENKKIKNLLKDKVNYYKNNKPEFNGSKIVHTYPGEKVSSVFPTSPSQNYVGYEASLLRDIAAGSNSSYETASKDYSRSNYSSTRAAQLEQRKATMVTRKLIADKFCRPVFALWLEEAIAKGDVEQLGDNPYRENISAYTKSLWNGPKAGHIDPLKEIRGDLEEIAGGLSTLEEKCAERGMDYEDILEQRHKEVMIQIEHESKQQEKRIELGLPVDGQEAEAADEEQEISTEGESDVPGETDEADQNEQTEA